MKFLCFVHNELKWSSAWWALRPSPSSQTLRYATWWARYPYTVPFFSQLFVHHLPFYLSICTWFVLQKFWLLSFIGYSKSMLFSKSLSSLYYSVKWKTATKTWMAGFLNFCILRVVHDPTGWFRRQHNNGFMGHLGDFLASGGQRRVSKATFIHGDPVQSRGQGQHVVGTSAKS